MTLGFHFVRATFAQLAGIKMDQHSEAGHHQQLVYDMNPADPPQMGHLG